MSARLGATMVLVAMLAIAPVRAQSSALITAPEGATAARRWGAHREALVDCAEHGVWTPPAGWTTGARDRASFAIAPDGSAAIVRVSARPRLRTDGEFIAHATRIATWLVSAPTLGAIEAVDRSRWQRVRAIEGVATRSGVRLRVIARARRTEALWVAVHREGDDAARASIEASIEGWQALTSHACACGSDCDRRPR